MTITVTEFAPAKINLSLHVTGKRDDGYHLLETLVVFADVGDKITASPADRTKLDIDGPFSHELEAHPATDNLVVKAATGLTDILKTHETGLPGVHLRLTKNLPVASGVGGGSADAAATIRAIRKLCPEARDIRESEIQEFATTLGADIPMCLKSNPVVATGVGDTLEEAVIPPVWLVLANPGIAVSTKEVFARLTLRDPPSVPETTEFSDAPELAAYLARTRNDLTKPALELSPVIGDVIETMEQTGDCLFARMSGSGSTCFGLYESRKHAEIAAKNLRSRYPQWWIETTRTLGTPP